MNTINNKIAANDDDTTLDSASVEAVKQKLLCENQKEIDELNYAVGNIRFSMTQLEKQLIEKQKILDNRLATKATIEKTTLESLLAK